MARQWHRKARAAWLKGVSLYTYFLLALCLQQRQSSRNAANEEQQAAGNLNKKSELPLQWEQRVKKRERATDGNEESSPERNHSCSPERDPKQRWTKDRANVKHHVIIA